MCILLLQGAQVLASGGSFGLTPAKLRVKVGSGERAHLSVNLVNNVSVPKTYRNYITGCTISRDGVREYPPPEEAGPYSAAQWIRITKGLDNKVVYPYEFFEITIEVNPPPGTMPGRY